jgi:hypothetical protein
MMRAKKVDAFWIVLGRHADGFCRVDALNYPNEAEAVKEADRHLPTVPLSHLAAMNEIMAGRGGGLPALVVDGQRWIYNPRENEMQPWVEVLTGDRYALPWPDGGRRFTPEEHEQIAACMRRAHT